MVAPFCNWPCHAVLYIWIYILYIYTILQQPSLYVEPFRSKNCSMGSKITFYMFHIYNFWTKGFLLYLQYKRICTILLVPWGALIEHLVHPTQKSIHLIPIQPTFSTTVLHPSLMCYCENFSVRIPGVYQIKLVPWILPLALNEGSSFRVLENLWHHVMLALHSPAPCKVWKN